MISSEDVGRGPVANITPLNPQFNADGSLLTFLYPDNTGARQVHGCTPAELQSGGDCKPVKLFDAMDMGLLSHEEQLRRERMRMFVAGVTSYEWYVKGQEEYMMIPINGRVLLYEKTSMKLECLYDGSKGPAIDPHMSPIVDSVAFIIGRDLYITHVDVETLFSEDAMDQDTAMTCSSTSLVRLTISGMKEGVSCGVADFVAQEEMDRYRGFWYSPDGSKIAYTKANEHAVAQYPIQYYGDDDPLRSEMHRYPFAGTNNPKVELAVLTIPSSLNASSSEPAEVVAGDIEAASVFMKISESTWDKSEYYLARVDWWPDGSVMAQVEDRNQSTLQLLRLNATTGERQVLLEECQDVWINLHDLWKPLDLQSISDDYAEDEGFGFLWGSERSGFMQIYLYVFFSDSPDQGAIQVSLDSIGKEGDWVVDSIVSVDPIANRVFLSGNRGDVCGKYLFCAPLLDHECTGCPTIVQITEEPGWHSCVVSPNYDYFCDVFSSNDKPPVSSLRTMPTLPKWRKQSSDDTKSPSIQKAVVIADAADNDNRYTSLKDGLLPPVIIPVPGEGPTLMCAVYVPEDVDVDWSSGRPLLKGSASRPLPCVVSVYGGPHVQRVQRTWALTADLRAQRLRQNGFVVVKCDNRGSSRRGIAFEGAVRHDMGNLELVDQATAVSFFSSVPPFSAVADVAPLVDSSRVGIYGWSYGGYMASMCLCRTPDVFRAGIAGAPVTHWDGYDTHYTERYMGHPNVNKGGYAVSSVMAHAEGLKGRLMLIHGLIDENVHFRHTARLIQKLNDMRKPYDLVLFPGERHSPHKISDRIYLEDRIFQFFDSELSLAKVQADVSGDRGSVAAAYISVPPDGGSKGSVGGAHLSKQGNPGTPDTLS
jgi:dipeptidyl-peptidase 4